MSVVKEIDNQGVPGNVPETEEVDRDRGGANSRRERQPGGQSGQSGESSASSSSLFEGDRVELDGGELPGQGYDRLRLLRNMVERLLGDGEDAIGGGETLNELQDDPPDSGGSFDRTV